MHTPEAIKGTVLLIDRAERLAGERQLFEGEGLRVMTATTAKEGLARRERKRPIWWCRKSCWKSRTAASYWGIV